MWKPSDNGARNMGIESFPYCFHAAEAQDFHYGSPSPYMNGNLSEQTVYDRNRRPVVHYHVVKSPDTFNNTTGLHSSSFIEDTPQYKQKHPTETWITRKRLKLDGEEPNELQQNNELIYVSEKPAKSTSKSETSKLCDAQSAPFGNIDLDNETLNNLKKIVQSTDISAIETKKPSDLQNSSSESEQLSDLQKHSKENKKLPDLHKLSSENEIEKFPDLHTHPSEDRTENVPSLEKLNIPFHKVHLDTATWENLKKITIPLVCLKTGEHIGECTSSHDNSLASQTNKDEILVESSLSQEDSSLVDQQTPSVTNLVSTTECTTNKDDSLVSQSTKSEILTESSLSQGGDSSLPAQQTPKVSNSVFSDGVGDKRKTSGDLWFLNEKDSLNHTNNKTPGSINRVRKSSLTCHSCGERGHSARFCTKVKKLPVCFICAREGHNGDFCRDVICSRCLHIGHPPERCRQFDRESSRCSVCNFPGHYTPECPDFWRRYHLTTTPGNIVYPPRPLVTQRIFCYNCAEEGHLGHDCEEERIDPYSFPYYPFIIDYTIPHI